MAFTYISYTQNTCLIEDYATIQLSQAEALDTKSGVTEVLKGTQECGKLDRHEV